MYHLAESEDYVSVVFRERDAVAALATAMKAQARLYVVG